MRTTRFASMDGIKGLALLAIVVYHLAQGSLTGGFVGVEVLFVVSGFLLTRSLVAEAAAHGGHIDLRRYYLRRLARLWPAMALMVLAVTALGMAVDTDTLVGIRAQSVAALTFSFNWEEIARGASYFAAASPQLLRPLWYVALLAQFTIALPWLVKALGMIPDRRLRPVATAAPAVASAAAMWLLYTPGADPTRVYFGTDTHCFGLFAGMTLAYLDALRPEAAGEEAGPAAPSALRRAVAAAAPWAATVALVALAVLAGRMGQDASAFRGGLAFAAVATMALVAGSIAPGSWMDRLFTWRPLALLGRYSYGIYLWHWPLFVLAQCLFPGLRGRWLWVIWLGVGVLTAGAAALSWIGVERPVGALAPASALSAAADGARPGAAAGRETDRRRRTALRVVSGAVAVALVIGFGVAWGNQPEKTKLQVRLEREQAALAERQRRQEDAARQAQEAARQAQRQAEDAARQAQQPLPGGVGGDQVSGFGDSVMLGAATALDTAMPGIAIDAQVSRFIKDAPGLVAAARQAGTLRRYVVISMNTNSLASVGTFQSIADAAGDGHVLVIVTAHGARSWIPVANQAAHDYVDAHGDTAVLADWDAAIATHPEWLVSDGIHPAPQGCDLYAATVRDAINAYAKAHPGR